jgi:anti-sigma regulatory factor (Ser/Thr protein kinase)
VPGAIAASTTLAGHHAAGAIARGFVRQLLQPALPQSVLDDVVLVVSELVTIVVETPSQGAVVVLRVTLRTDRGSVRVATEGRPIDRAEVERRYPLRIRLIAALSARWGVEAGPPPAVWAELDV